MSFNVSGQRRRANTDLGHPPRRHDASRLAASVEAQKDARPGISDLPGELQVANIEGHQFTITGDCAVVVDSETAERTPVGTNLDALRRRSREGQHSLVMTAIRRAQAPRPALDVVT